MLGVPRLSAYTHQCGQSPAKRFLLGVVSGMMVGLLLAVSWPLSGLKLSGSYAVHRRQDGGFRGTASRQRSGQEKGLTRELSQAAVWDRVLNSERPVQDIHFDDQAFHHDDDTEARRLAKEVRVLIWVMTSPKTLQSRARRVRDTWGTRANLLLFFSSEEDKEFPAIGLNVSEGREHLLSKTVKAFRYIYKHHLDDADWFMKVDDDTYVIVENLRYFLSGENTLEPVYFGHHFTHRVPQGFYGGGAGYVLSKEALMRFGQKGHDPSLCRQDLGSEDSGFGQCMQNLGVRVANTTDSLGRSRFHCFGAEVFISGDFPSWFLSFDTNGAKRGLGSLSDYPISFHHISPSRMYALEYFVYHLRPYGIRFGLQDLNKPGNNITLRRKP